MESFNLESFTKLIFPPIFFIILLIIAFWFRLMSKKEKKIWIIISVILGVLFLVGLVSINIYILGIASTLLDWMIIGLVIFIIIKSIQSRKKNQIKK